MACWRVLGPCRVCPHERANEGYRLMLDDCVDGNCCWSAGMRRPVAKAHPRRLFGAGVGYGAGDQVQGLANAPAAMVRRPRWGRVRVRTRIRLRTVLSIQMFQNCSGADRHVRKMSLCCDGAYLLRKKPQLPFPRHVHGTRTEQHDCPRRERVQSEVQTPKQNSMGPEAMESRGRNVKQLATSPRSRAKRSFVARVLAWLI